MAHQDLPTTLNSIDPNTLLNRRKTAEVLQECGIDITRGGLAILACRGGGPPYHKIGRTVLYKWRDVSAWLYAKLGKAASSSVEHRHLHEPARCGEDRRSNTRKAPIS
jgi:hypothetical protein